MATLIRNACEVAHSYGRRVSSQRCIENSQRTYEQMRKRGIRVVIGGDYGFAWTPQGTNARDIEHFVKIFGYSPSEALQCATRVGGELMGLPVGLLKPGQLADLLVVDGDPLHDVRVLQDPSRLKLIMEDGTTHKNTLGEVVAAHERRVA